jgi:hypothetical protein
MKWDEDLAHRTLWTFVQTFTGVLVASSLLDLNVDLIAAGVAAAVADVLVVVKEYARRKLEVDNETGKP